jgi:hypothetical protein
VTAGAGSSDSFPQDPDPGLQSKVFIVQGDRKLVRYLSFAKAAGERPDSLRVFATAKLDTSFTLKNKSFTAQYARAIETIAKFHGIPNDHPIREAMTATAKDFLAYYNLRTQTISIERNGERRTIDNVALPIDGEGAETDSPSPNSQVGARPPQAMLPGGLVRGVTFRSAVGNQPAHIHVRRWRGKALSFTLENVSFAVQYEKAVMAMADSLGLAIADPTRALMLGSGQTFLQHYGLATAPITIPDVVVIVPQTE